MLVDEVVAVKRRGQRLCSFEDFCRIVGNKSVFTRDDLWRRYSQDYNVTVIRMLYCGYFGAGNNVNYAWLEENGLWSPQGMYPTELKLSRKQCGDIWEQGGIDVPNAVGR